MRKFSFALPVLALSAVACTSSTSGPNGSEPSPTPAPAEQVEVVKSAATRADASGVAAADRDAIVADYNDFSFAFYHEATKEIPGGAIVSPYSAALALSMTAAGARGDTAKEIRTALHQTLPAERLDPALNWLDQTIASSSLDSQGRSVSRLSSANALFTDKQVAVKTPFLDTLATYYGAGVNKVDFRGNPDVSRLQINDWVEQKTEKKITELLPSDAVNSSTRFVLVNAIYFSGRWTQEFSKGGTAPAPFTKLDGTVASVPTMNNQLHAAYAKGADYEALSLPFKGRTELVVIAPTAGQFAAYDAKLDGKSFRSVLDSLNQVKLLQLALPKFQEEGAFKLVPALRALGMSRAFEAGSADFTGIADAEFYLSDVLQKTYLKVDEEGAEAAAATAVIGAGSSAPIDPPIPVKIDRPFITAIVDSQTKAVLFVGRVTEPK